MKLIDRNLLLGLGMGIALTLLGLHFWGNRYQEQLYFATAPAVLRPFTQQPVPRGTPNIRAASQALGPGSVVYRSVGGANWDDDAARSYLHALAER
jgi:hypothetical protein